MEVKLVTDPNVKQVPVFKAGFRSHDDIYEKTPLDFVDSSEDYPHLTLKDGNPWSNTPKMIHAMRVCP
jgi:hypothetical protein